MKRRAASRLLSASIACVHAAGAATAQATPEVLRGEVVRGYTAWCHALYQRAHGKAKELQTAVDALLAKPGPATLDAAQKAWIESRRVYGQTEVLRFCDWPIETLEPLLNSWPVDEAYIDYVAGNPDAGIVNDPVRYPNLGETVLVLANERGGEANVSTGWHAIEFLLWGQDLSAAGPGCRPASDFDVKRQKHAARRGEYLRATCALLVRHLGEVAAAWAPGTDAGTDDRAPNHRRKLEADPDAALRAMLAGAVVLTAFELGGERLTVAHDTKDQEQEHSCFSDTTWLDFEANQLGLIAVLRGASGGGTGPGLLALVEQKDEKLAARVVQRLDTTLARLRAIPRPFDQAMLGADDAPGRTAMRAAIAALEEQSDVLLIVGRSFGFDLPLQPGG